MHLTQERHREAALSSSSRVILAGITLAAPPHGIRGRTLRRLQRIDEWWMRRRIQRSNMTFDEPGSLTTDSRLFELELGPDGAGLQVLRIVIDGVQECNMRCLYCHPGEVWLQKQLDARTIGEVLAAAEEYGCLEVVLSGGEITMHHQLAHVLEATHRARRTTVTLITNATMLTPACIDALTESNVTRICVSLDGVDNNTHGSARGKNLKAVLSGLRAVQATGREITVISVAHQQNFRRLVELSRFLADAGLAGQHHLCAPSYSGTAREHYPDLKLRLVDYFTLQLLLAGNRTAVKRRRWRPHHHVAAGGRAAEGCAGPR